LSSERIGGGTIPAPSTNKKLFIVKKGPLGTRKRRLPIKVKRRFVGRRREKTPVIGDYDWAQRQKKRRKKGKLPRGKKAAIAKECLRTRDEYGGFKDQKGKTMGEVEIK